MENYSTTADLSTPEHALYSTEHNAPSALEQALYLVRQQVAVFPCKRQDKSPLTKNGFKDASTDEHQVRRWWGPWPNALIGAPTGLRFDVLDLDLQHEEARNWLASHRLPVTRTHHTRRGGLHLLFRPTEGLTNSIGRLAHGVDIRARGGYVIWWPAHGFAVENHDGVLAELPGEILAALMPPPAKAFATGANDFQNTVAVEERLGVLVDFIVEAEEGERNARLYWAARRFVEIVAEGDVEEGWAREVLFEAGIATGLPHRECIATIRSAFQNLEVQQS